MSPITQSAGTGLGIVGPEPWELSKLTELNLNLKRSHFGNLNKKELQGDGKGWSGGSTRPDGEAILWVTGEGAEQSSNCEKFTEMEGAYLIEVGHDISRQCFHRDVRFLPSLNDPHEPFCWPHKKRQANQPQSIKEKRPKVFLEVPYGAMFVVNCRA